MKQVTIYHNPRCSTSRKTLALLKEHDIQPTVIDYLKNPPARDEIASFIKMLGRAPISLVRTKEPLFQSSGLSPDSSAD